MLSSLRDHVQRLRYQFGRPFEIGEHRYRARGYFSNPFVHEGHHEPHLLKPLQRVLMGRAGAFVDVGVNVGQTLRKVLEIDPQRTYVGFEPQVSCCFYVGQFLRENQLDRARVLPIALSDTNTYLKLFSALATDEMATTVDSIAAESARHRFTLVPARRGDEVMQELALDEVAMVKVDVEGAELSVLRGLENTLRHQRPSVLFEVLPNFHGVDRVPHPVALREQNNLRARQLFGFLTACGYAIFQIDAQGEEARIEGFDLDTTSRFIGSDYIAHATG